MLELNMAAGLIVTEEKIGSSFLGYDDVGSSTEDGCCSTLRETQVVNRLPTRCLYPFKISSDILLSISLNGLPLTDTI